jgi:hypothetical protein
MNKLVLTHIIIHGLLFGLIMTGSLFIIMVTASPRIWGYSDYSDAIKSKVPPQTAKEKRLAVILFIPWMLLALGLPIASTILLKHKLGGDIPFWIAFLNLFVMTALSTLGDVIVLDWLIVSRISPRFVIIPGTEAADYKDMSHHYKAHLKAAPILTALCLIMAAGIWFF